MANLEIFFFLLGDSSPSNDTFPITASPGDSVGELKDKVYALVQNSLHVKGIDARNLILWKVLPLCSFHRIMC
jgi:Crinkler effector protein N-terminal domain